MNSVKIMNNQPEEFRIGMASSADREEVLALYALQKGRVEESGDPDEVYRAGGIYKQIVDASARSLNVEKLARTIDSDRDGRFFD